MDIFFTRLRSFWRLSGPTIFYLFDKLQFNWLAQLDALIKIKFADPAFIFGVWYFLAKKSSYVLLHTPGNPSEPGRPSRHSHWRRRHGRTRLARRAQRTDTRCNFSVNKACVKWPTQYEGPTPVPSPFQLAAVVYERGSRGGEATS